MFDARPALSGATYQGLVSVEEAGLTGMITIRGALEEIAQPVTEATGLPVRPDDAAKPARRGVRDLLEHDVSDPPDLRTEQLHVRDRGVGTERLPGGEGQVFGKHSLMWRGFGAAAKPEPLPSPDFTG